MPSNVNIPPEQMPRDNLNIDMPRQYMAWITAFAKSRQITAAELYRRAVYEYIRNHSEDRGAPIL